MPAYSSSGAVTLARVVLPKDRGPATALLLKAATLVERAIVLVSLAIVIGSSLRPAESGSGLSPVSDKASSEAPGWYVGTPVYPVLSNANGCSTVIDPLGARSRASGSGSGRLVAPT